MKIRKESGQKKEYLFACYHRISIMADICTYPGQINILALIRARILAALD
ncbi:hypothetical protein [Desulfobacula sp.]